jgi:uncharacterized membrane protein YdbT with pleckstrin-like domain
MDLHSGEEIVFEGHPSWRAILGFYVLGIAAAVVVGLLVGIVADTGPGVVVVLAGLVVVLVVGLVKRIETRYVVTNQRLRIRRGVLSRRVQQTRLDRVQNVNTSQSLLDRVLGVGTVDFDTAGSDDSEFAFRGIASPDEVVAAVDRAVREAPPAP